MRANKLFGINLHLLSTMSALPVWAGFCVTFSVLFRLQIEQMEPGLKITDGGKEKKVAAGWIDITAEDKNGAAVVIELKAGEADRDAIGQILSYMGDMSLENKAVRGILVAGEFAPRAVAAARVVPNLRLEKYSFSFAFTPVS